jgi:hypothetical protein
MFSTLSITLGSLYRFLFISGIVLVLSSSYLSFSIKREKIAHEKLSNDTFADDEKTAKMFWYVGLILFVGGVLLWDTKIQKPQDKLLQIQLKTAEIALETAELNLEKLKDL